MKSWADHCSSDEESFNEDTPMDAFDDDDDGEVAAENQQTAEVTARMDDMKGPTTSSEDGQPPRHQQEKVYEFPAGPPFTIFVGNLAYSIKDGDELGEALANLVRDRLQQDITVVKGRVGSGGRGAHNNPQEAHKGFGYVEVSSVEDMKLALELNKDSGAMLAGRKVKLDTANHNSDRRGSGSRFSNDNFNRGGPRRGSAPEADGKQFRGGKFNQNTRNSNQNAGPRRHSHGTEGGGRGAGGAAAAAAPPPPVGQRPSLKLKPRTKPVEDVAAPTEKDTGIFGGAKPRETSAWEPKGKRQSDAAPHDSNKDVVADLTHDEGGDKNHRRTSGRGGGGGRGRGDGNDENRHGRGRGGRGRGGVHGDTKGGGRGGGRGHDKNIHKKEQRDDKKKAKGQTPAVAKAPVAAPPVAAAEKPAERKKSNTFAALAFDSDSD